MREDRERQREEEEKAKDADKPEPQREQEREKEREKWRENMRKMWAGKSQAERKKDSESRNPNQMAQRMAYWNAMSKRMQARGIQPPRWGPGGMGRGSGGPRQRP
jgi:hypothetical protein